MFAHAWFTDGMPSELTARGILPELSFWLLTACLLATRSLGSDVIPGQIAAPLPHISSVFWGPAGNAHHRVIFYDDGGMNFAARAALCARWAGFMNAQILDGGLSAWARCGLPLNDGAPAAADHPAAERVNDFLRQTIAGAVPQILGKAAFFNAVKQGDRLVIDGRPRERFAGRTENLDARPGHVPGAVNRPATENLDADGSLKSREALRREWGVVIGGRDPRSIVQMCGSGVAACLNSAALDAAGILPIAEAALYPGSWSQWAADSNLPAEIGCRDTAE